MQELRITVIDNNTAAPSVSKTVAIHISDADVVFNRIAAGSSPLKAIAPALGKVVNAVLQNAGDTDKIEITPTGGIHHKANGEEVPFSF